MRLNVAALAVAALLAPIAGAQTGPPVVKKGRPPQAAPKETLDAIKATQSTANVSSPTSDVKGLAFDRIVQIWLENTNFEAAAGDPNFQWIASQGILLKNYFAVTHPSQPNYAAVVSGDNFGMDHDDFFRFPENISTIFDLLDTKSISWGAYQEHLPYAGYPGFNFSNQKSFANDYVRKHNPPIMFDSVSNKPERASQIKNFTSFYDDLKAKKLPQWSFVTPNMTNDGHDTNYRFSGRWAKGFLEPLLNNSYFTDRTLIILSFDESEVYTIQNRIFTVLLGGAVDRALRGTSDSMFYTHYSTIATVSANWGLPSLGRWDCGANILALVANKTNYANVMPAGIDGSGSGGATLFLNMTYPGPASNSLYTPGWWPTPDTKSTCSAGNGVLPAVVSAWSSAPGPAYNYSYAFPYDDRSHINTAVPPVRGNKASTAGGGGNSTVSGGGQSPTSGGGSTTGPSQPRPNVAGRAMGVPSVGALAAVAACSLIGV